MQVAGRVSFLTVVFSLNAALPIEVTVYLPILSGTVTSEEEPLYPVMRALLSV